MSSSLLCTVESTPDGPGPGTPAGRAQARDGRAGESSPCRDTRSIPRLDAVEEYQAEAA